MARIDCFGEPAETSAYRVGHGWRGWLLWLLGRCIERLTVRAALLALYVIARERGADADMAKALVAAGRREAVGEQAEPETLPRMQRGGSAATREDLAVERYAPARLNASSDLAATLAVHERKRDRASRYFQRRGVRIQEMKDG